MQCALLVQVLDWTLLAAVSFAPILLSIPDWLVWDNSYCYCQSQRAVVVGPSAVSFSLRRSSEGLDCRVITHERKFSKILIESPIPLPSSPRPSSADQLPTHVLPAPPN